MKAVGRSLLVTLLALVVLSIAGGACGGVESTLALGEPVRVKGAQFLSGDLPGTAPGVPGPPDLRVTATASQNRVVLPGQGGKKIDGRASGRASAIALRFADLGSGYWVFPLGAPDPQFPGELSWEAELDFELEAAAHAPGYHPLRVVAIDDSGAAGEQNEIVFCFASITPDDLASCDPKATPPDAVVSLTWDTAADLDLRATLPGGVVLDPKHPVAPVDPDAGADGGAPADAPYVTRDSLASCVDDGRRQEDVVFPKRPKGSVDLYAHLFAPCGARAVGFRLVVFEAQGDPPNRRLVETLRKAGRIVDVPSGNESEQPPLYVTTVDF